MTKIEIAPNVFVSSWNEVSHGYQHVGGRFIIVLANGGNIHVQGEEEIQTTIDLWRSRSEAPLNPISTETHSDQPPTTKVTKTHQMYKILVEYQIIADRSWSAMITVGLPINPRKSFKIASEYIHSKEHLLGEELEAEWGEFSSDRQPLRSRSTALGAQTLAALEQKVANKIFEIQSQIHRIVIGYEQMLEHLPPAYTLEVDPRILEIKGIAFEVNEDLELWRFGLRAGDSCEFQSASGLGWEQITISEISDVSDYDRDGRTRWQITSTANTTHIQFVGNLFPTGSMGWRHEISEGDRLRVKPESGAIPFRIDRVKSVRHNYRSSKMLVIWESDGYEQIVDYADIFSPDSLEPGIKLGLKTN